MHWRTQRGSEGFNCSPLIFEMCQATPVLIKSYILYSKTLTIVNVLLYIINTLLISQFASDSGCRSPLSENSLIRNLGTPLIVITYVITVFKMF